MVSMATTVSDVYDLPEEHKDFRDTIRQIVDERVRPRAADIDRAGVVEERRVVDRRDPYHDPYA